ncbi:MAG TPA: hypothetical protein VMS11_01815 [Solirubrobacterales bacterium]|nr:hypothetical protein [Solirubrobacterales bacterium]
MSTDTLPKPIPERVALIESGEIKLLRSSHKAPPPDCTHPDGCSEELCNWGLGLEWSDRSEDTEARKSPVIASFRRVLQDNLPDDLRQQLNGSVFWGIGTKGDGRDEDRAWMCADWSIRVVLPAWLDLAGTEDAAADLRALPEVTASTVAQARKLVDPLANAGWRRWDEALADLRAKVRKAVEEELAKQGSSRAAEAAEAARAAEAAGAAGAAGAARADLYQPVYDAVYKAFMDEFAPVQTALLPSAIDLLKRMCELEPAA